ncbi:unnamed protein product [Prorocentrum cordatum]|uniref:Uncharacterized protein n=1 Tax=Prorocentrum cordatum TaxID=2364126 RepID=A0ABN9UP26_9DINO|nr:unnamed protein product [Polarella glacialis]
MGEQFPSHAVAAQRALTMQNHIGTAAGELETCAASAASASGPRMRELEGWKELAIESAVSLNVPSANCSKTLLGFVEHVVGGDGAPLAACTDSVAQHFGCNVTLGQTHWEALAQATFTSKTNVHPSIRVAIAIVNLRGDKVEDRVARLLANAGIANVAGQTVTFDEWAKYEKDVAAQKLCAVFSIGQTVKLRESVNRYSDREPYMAEIALAGLIEKWSISEAEPPKQVEGDQQRPQRLYIDKRKAAVYRALLELDAKRMSKHNLVSWRKSDGVRTTTTIKQGQLALVTVAKRINLHSNNTGSGISLSDRVVDSDTTQNFAVFPVGKPKDNGTTQFDEAEYGCALVGRVNLQ